MIVKKAEAKIRSNKGKRYEPPRVRSSWLEHSKSSDGQFTCHDCCYFNSPHRACTWIDEDYLRELDSKATNTDYLCYNFRYNPYIPNPDFQLFGGPS